MTTARKIDVQMLALANDVSISLGDFHTYTLFHLVMLVHLVPILIVAAIVNSLFTSI